MQALRRTHSSTERRRRGPEHALERNAYVKIPQGHVVGVTLFFYIKNGDFPVRKNPREKQHSDQERISATETSLTLVPVGPVTISPPHFCSA